MKIKEILEESLDDFQDKAQQNKIKRLKKHKQWQSTGSKGNIPPIPSDSLESKRKRYDDTMKELKRKGLLFRR